MLKPVRVSSAAPIAKWNQSIPKYHRYNGTAVNVRTNVPIRNALVVQLIRSIGMRKTKGGNVGETTDSRCRPGQNHVLFCPGVNVATMRAGELLGFDFGRAPAFFFYGPSGVGQL